MPARQDLHVLIDTLPEQAIELVEEPETRHT